MEKDNKKLRGGLEKLFKKYDKVTPKKQDGAPRKNYVTIRTQQETSINNENAKKNIPVEKNKAPQRAKKQFVAPKDQYNEPEIPKAKHYVLNPDNFPQKDITNVRAKKKKKKSNGVAASNNETLPSTKSNASTSLDNKTKKQKAPKLQQKPTKIPAKNQKKTQVKVSNGKPQEPSQQPTVPNGLGRKRKSPLQPKAAAMPKKSKEQFSMENYETDEMSTDDDFIMDSYESETDDSETDESLPYGDDSTDFSSDFGSIISNSYSESSSDPAEDYAYHGHDDDPDYELPEGELEDLIVHPGLSISHKLEAHHGVEFDEEIEQAQIIELPKQEQLKSIEQPEAYHIERLVALQAEFLENTKKFMSRVRTAMNSDDDDCPNLVPIETDEDGFQLWNPGVSINDEMFSYDDVAEEIDSDESSTLSYSDVNGKYLKRCIGGSSDDDSDDSDDEKQRASIDMIAVIVMPPPGDHDEGPRFGERIENEKLTQQCLSLEEIMRGSEDDEQAASVVTVAVYDDSSESDIEASKMHDLTERELQLLSSNDEFYEPSATTIENSFEIEDLDSTQDSETEMIGPNDSFLEKDEDTSIQGDEPTDLLTKYQAGFQKSPSAQFYNSIDACQVLALLKSSFFIYGTVKVTLVSGSISIYGYSPKIGETLLLHSPRGCSAPCVSNTTVQKTTQATTKTDDLEAQINAACGGDDVEFSARDLRQLLANFEPSTDAIILLSRNFEADKVKQTLKQHMNENIFPVRIPRQRPLCASERLLDCLINDTTAYPLEVPRQWCQLNLESHSRFLFVGGKSVGKSTLLRYMLNRYLNQHSRILIIDLDIGQPEVFVPQTVSCTIVEQPLVGPGFLAQKLQPEKAFVIGQTNVALCARSYMSAVMELLRFCKSNTDYSELPWLVNTMGYNKGFGPELITVICELLQPTDLVQFESSKPINNFDFYLDSNALATVSCVMFEAPATDALPSQHKLHLLPPAVPQLSRYGRDWQMSAKDLRYIMLLARLSELLPEENECFTAEQTFCCNLEELTIVNLISKHSSEMQTLKALESNLVYLCHSSTTIVDADSDSDVRNHSSTERPLETIGIGIVRAVDYQMKKVYLVVAVPPVLLARVNCLALGEMPLPASLLLQQEVSDEHNIQYVQSMEDIATSKAVKQFFYRTPTKMNEGGKQHVV